MTIHIKTITAPHERIENFLNQLVKSGCWTRIKDTYTLSQINEATYEQVIEFENELKEEGLSIMVKKNGL